MKYLSVCSGIEAATVAWHEFGWQPFAFSEIEAFPSAVLAHHYPNVPNLGDMTKFQEWPDAAIDLLVGGTPCQSFSVAGLRKGLADPRGNLMLTFGAIAAKYRPRWLVWENVPGVLSSNKGRDFGAFLGMLGELGYGFAYRVLDAQYFGVPQRRRRVFVVGYLGDWRAAAAVLFERQSLSGNPAPSRQARQVVAALTANGVGACGADDNQGQAGHLIAATLDASFGRLQGCSGQDAKHGHSHLVTHVNEVSRALTACKTATGRLDPNEMEFVAQQPYTLAIRGRGDHHNLEYRQDGTANALLTPNGGRGGIGVGAIAYRTAGDGAVFEEGEATAPLTTGTDQCANIVGGNLQVRRLMPPECERLQGFPDGYTLIPNRGKPAADGPRYKALGNSMAVPVMRWIGERIQAVDAVTSAKVAA